MSPLSVRQQTLREDLLQIIPSTTRVSVSESVLDQHAGDMTFHKPHLPDVVVFPETTAEVSEVLALASRRQVPVIPYGAGTSLEGHVVPIHGGVSLDLSRMNRIDVYPEDLQAVVGAGVMRSELNRVAGQHGLFFSVDPGADATLGGMAATNASGTTTLRYGAMRSQVLGLHVVLADGQILKTGGRTLKTSAGYGLTQLFIGSEGTLGVITELVLRLYGIPESAVTIRVVFPDVTAAVNAAIHMVAAGASATRIELLDRTTLELVNAHRGTDFPVGDSLFIEFTGSPAAVEAEAETARELAGAEGSLSFDVESDPTRSVQLWRARHEAAFALMASAPGKKHRSTDACVPLSQLPGAVTRARELVDHAGIPACIAGHVGDGNYHVAFMLDPADPSELAVADELSRLIVEDALAREGTCTGEHGIGLGKTAFLQMQHPDLIPLMCQLKRAVDPGGILNPGKVLPGSLPSSATR